MLNLKPSSLSISILGIRLPVKLRILGSFVGIIYQFLREFCKNYDGFFTKILIIFIINTFDLIIFKV